MLLPDYKEEIGIKRIGGVLALFGVIAALTAWGVSRTTDPVAAAATKTEQAGGVKMAMSVDVNAAGKAFSITADGTFDHAQGELTVDLSSALQSAGISGVGDGIKVLYLQEDGDLVLYVNVPALAQRIPGGKSWIRLDLQQAGKSFGLDVDQLLSQSAQNPAQLLDLLRSVGQIDKVGTETINGIATTEYKGAVDLTKAAALKGGLASNLVQRLIAQGAPSELPVEVWVGDDGLVRRLRLSEDMQTGGQSLSAVVTIDMSDFGATVSVSAPPADDVFDATALAALASQAQTGTTTGPSGP